MGSKKTYFCVCSRQIDRFTAGPVWDSDAPLKQTLDRFSTRLELRTVGIRRGTRAGPASVGTGRILDPSRACQWVSLYPGSGLCDERPKPTSGPPSRPFICRARPSNGDSPRGREGLGCAANSRKPAASMPSQKPSLDPDSPLDRARPISPAPLPRAGRVECCGNPISQCVPSSMMAGSSAIKPIARVCSD